MQKRSCAFHAVITKGVILLSLLFLPVAAQATVTLNDTITGDIHLTSFPDNTYVFTAAAIQVTRSMIIDAGVLVRFFTPGAVLTIGGDPAGPATLVANGSAGASRIVFQHVGAATSWGGVRVIGASYATMNYCDMGITNGTPNYGLQLQGDSSAVLNNCRLRGVNGVQAMDPTRKLFMDSCEVTANNNGIVLTRTASANILYSSIYARLSGVICTGVNTPTLSPVVIYFSSVRGNSFTLVSNTGATVNAEFNYYPQGAPVLSGSTSSLIDTAPSLNSNPYPFTSAGLAAGSPIIINAAGNAVVDYDQAIPGGNTAATFRYYRVDNGTLIVTSNAALRIGKVPTADIVMGGSIVAVNGAANGITVTGNGVFELLGTSGTHRSKYTSAQDLSGSGASGQCATLNIGPNASASINYGYIACATGINTDTSAVTITNTLITTMNNGLICNNALPYIIYDSFMNITNFNIVANNNPAVTIAAEYNYFGAVTPNYAKFSGTGIIDYEPWYSDAALTIVNTSPPTPSTLITPPNGANLGAAPLEYIFSGFDIGMYNGKPLLFQILVATNSAMTSVVISDNIPVGGGTTGNGISFYPTTNALTPGVRHYWQVRAIDPYGSNTWSAWSVTWDFMIQGPSINIMITANEAQGGAGDQVNYIVSFNNTGGAAINSRITNVLPVYVFFNNTGASVRIPANANQVTFSAWDAATGGTQLGYEALVPNGAAQPITWAQDPLTNAEAMRVRRVEIDIQTITRNVQGFIYYRTNIR